MLVFVFQVWLRKLMERLAAGGRRHSSQAVDA